MPWTPFHCLPQAKLTAAGLLQLDTQDQEVELLRRSEIELRHDNVDPMGPCPRGEGGPWESKTENLSITITTHRLVLSLDNDARFLHLSNIHTINPTGGPTALHWNASHKLILSTYTYGDLILAYRRSTNAGADRDACQAQLEKALERRAWETAARLQEKQVAKNQVARRKVGVDHILTKSKLKHQQNARLADEALGGDAEQLLKEAAELLQVIQKYMAILEKEEQSGKTSDEDQSAQEHLATMLQDMGMTSALTKQDVTKKEYYEFLARQVADFFLPKLPQMGGVLSLTDVFCLFNRARGSNLISPEDLTEACGLLAGLNLGISQRTFPSGIVVLQLDSKMGDASLQKELVRLCPTTALEASHVLKMSPFLAQEQFEEAERLGLLCRDVTLATTRFYPNRFQDEWQ